MARSKDFAGDLASLMSRGMIDNSVEAQEAIGRLFDGGKTGEKLDGFMRDAASRIKEGRHVQPDDIADDPKITCDCKKFQLRELDEGEKNGT